MGGGTASHLTTQNSYKLLCKTDTNTMEAIRKNRGARKLISGTLNENFKIFFGLNAFFLALFRGDVCLD